MSRVDEIAISYERLYAEHARAPFGSAVPYPHVLIDDLFDERDLDTIRSEFPEDSDSIWQRNHHSHSRKQALADKSLMGPVSQAYFDAVASSAFLRALEEITGIPDLEPDPDLAGGGYHLTLPGGYLDIHADFPRHHRLPLRRRLNLITYLGRDWAEGDGGMFEMWNQEAGETARRVEPVFNRSLIFLVSPDTYHGHPVPLRRHRRPSLAVFYYTRDSSMEAPTSQPATDYLENRNQPSPGGPANG
jgi:Rps23 Pro-64 3,4-dihydroxylase Tpa1-like proline 4-hydroxylase